MKSTIKVILGLGLFLLGFEQRLTAQQWNCKDPSWLKYGYFRSISGHDDTGTDQREELGIYSQAVFPARYVNNLDGPVGYPNGKLPAQQWIDYPGVYKDIKQMTLAAESSPIPGLIDGCGATAVPLDFLGLRSYYSSRLKNVSSPYGGFGVYAPFDIRFVIRKVPNDQLIVYSGGVEVEVFDRNKSPKNLSFPDRIYSSAGNARYILASETFDVEGRCSIIVRDDWGTLTTASCRENWRVENLRMANRQDTASAYYLANEGAVSAEAAPHFYFLDKVTTPSGLVTTYNYQSSSDFLSSIVMSSSTGSRVSTTKFTYQGIGRKARLQTVTLRDEVVGEERTATLGYANGFLTSINSPFGAVMFSYDWKGRMDGIFTKSATTIYPVGRTKFTYNVKDQVTEVGGPLVYGAANPAGFGLPLKLKLEYIKAADWIDPLEIKNVIKVTDLATNFESYITSVEQNFNVTRITSWDSGGGGVSISHAEPFSHAFPIDSIQDRNGYSRYWKHVRPSSGSGGPIGYPGQTSTSDFMYYVSEAGFSAPQNSQIVYRMKPIGADLRNWDIYDPASQSRRVVKYDDYGIQICQETFYSDGNGVPSYCGSLDLSSAGVSGRWVCEQIELGRCIKSSFQKSGKDSGGSEFPPFNVVTQPDPNYPWLDSVIEDISGKTVVSREGAETRVFSYMGDKFLGSTSEIRDYFGPKSVTSVVPYSVGPAGDSYTTTIDSKFANGMPQQVTMSSGHRTIQTQHPNLLVPNSAKFVSATNGQSSQVAMTLNNSGFVSASVWTWGQTTSSSAKLGFDADVSAFSPTAPAFPADECDPSSATAAARCSSAVDREVCRPVARPYLEEGEVGLKYFYWKYVPAGAACTAPCADGSMGCGTCVSQLKVKGFDIPTDYATEKDPTGKLKTEIDLQYPVCEIFTYDSSRSCCSLANCDYNGMNRYNEKYRCKALYGVENIDCPPSEETDYCSPPTNTKQLPAICRGSICSNASSTGGPRRF